MKMFSFLFDQDSLFAKITGWIAMLVISNLLFLFFCIPVITAGASLTALFTVVMKSIRKKEPVSVIKEFWQAFRTNFLPATGLYLLLGLAGALLFFNISVCSRLGNGFEIPGMAFSILLFLELLYSVFAFSALAAFCGRLTQIMKNAFYFFFHGRLLSLAGSLVFFLLPAIMVLDERNRPAWVFILFFIGWSAGAAASGYFLLKQYGKYLSV